MPCTGGICDRSLEGIAYTVLGIPSHTSHSMNLNLNFVSGILGGRIPFTITYHHHDLGNNSPSGDQLPSRPTVWSRIKSWCPPQVIGVSLHFLWEVPAKIKHDQKHSRNTKRCQNQKNKNILNKWYNIATSSVICSFPRVAEFASNFNNLTLWLAWDDWKSPQRITAAQMHQSWWGLYMDPGGTSHGTTCTWSGDLVVKLVVGKSRNYTLPGGFNLFETYYIYSHIGSFPQENVKIKNVWSHHLVQSRYHVTIPSGKLT